MDEKNIISALNAIDPSGLDYQEWLSVGMALHTEGFGPEVWDEWSRNDKRYHSGECERKWAGFRGSANPVTAGTIVKLATDRGWRPGPETETEGSGKAETGVPRQLIRYLEALFRPEDIVGYVTSDVFKGKEGRWCPSKGVYTRTAGELISALKSCGDNIGVAVGRWKPEAGAWIRFNPLDGKGVRNENVTGFRYALVECDSIPMEEQEKRYKELQLPIACLVSSGGKSLHAIVKVDAKDADEYRKRVSFLYDFLEKNSLPLDKANRNPSRLSRMPGVTRNGKLQKLMAVNIGCKSWEEWLDFAEGNSEGDTGLELFNSELLNDPPVLADELIHGVLRKGHKMLISGPSKAGKSFLLLELAAAIAEGQKWLGLEVTKGRVLYLNLEIDRDSCINRCVNIYKAMGITPDPEGNLYLLNLRGKAMPLDRLVPTLIRRMRGKHFDAVIIDPIYKVLTGDENNASDMGYFCNQFDRICDETGCAVIYCHHHSKGAQGGKKAMDRASGSGVFARDPDAQLDIIQLELSDYTKNFVRDGDETAWRLEGTLREFGRLKPINFWFRYPLHVVDENNLNDSWAEGDSKASLSKSGKRTSSEERKKIISTAFQLCCMEGAASVNDMAEYTGLSEKTIRRYLNEAGGYEIKKGLCYAEPDRDNGT